MLIEAAKALTAVLGLSSWHGKMVVGWCRGMLLLRRQESGGRAVCKAFPMFWAAVGELWGRGKTRGLIEMKYCYCP